MWSFFFNFCGQLLCASVLFAVLAISPGKEEMKKKEKAVRMLARAERGREREDGETNSPAERDNKSVMAKLHR